MSHPLANLAFLLGGAATLAALAITVETYWPQIRAALKGGADAHRHL